MQKERLYYLDWLRIGAFALLIIFHCTRFFDFFPWHVKNREQSEFVTQVFLFTTSWRMPLIFFVSGAGTYFAMRSKREHFLTGRVKRLLVPYAFGILLLIPPQKYYEYLYYNEEAITFFEFLSVYPSQIANAQNGFNLTWFGLLGYHIWYLPYLFVQTLLLIPIFKWMGRTEKALSPRFNLWLLFIPVVTVNVLLRPLFPDYLNWADFFHFLLFFWMGYWFVKNQKILIGKVLRSTKAMGVLAIGTSLVQLYFALFTQYMIKWVDRPDFSADYLAFVAVRHINAMSWVIFLLGLSIRYLNFNRSVLPKLNDSVLPVYVLHQTFIIVLGFFVVTWDIGMLPKFLIILILSSIAMYLTYMVIKRIRVLRFLFGMR